MNEDIREDAIKVRGMFRVQILNPDGEIAGDSGFVANQITNDGFNQYVVSLLGAIAGSKQISFVALGSGGAPASNATSLTGEVGSRTGVTAATSSSSKTVRFTATFPAGWHTSAGAGYNISNIALANTSSGGTIFAGNTYASSACASNQAVNITYDIIFT